MKDERRIRMDDGEGSEADGATAIVLRFGDVEVPARLNGTETARAFAARLPVTVDVSGTGVDFCGRLPFSTTRAAAGSPCCSEGKRGPRLTTTR